MAALIKWDTVGEILLESLVAAVVVVGLVALGARLLAQSEGAGQGQSVNPTGAGRGGSIGLACLCFLVALAAIGYGVYFTIDK